MTNVREGVVFPALLVLGVSAWLWPIGVGGRMPVGGDVSAFSIGLTSVLTDALHDGRLPYWNDLWGYGFPGIGESQMGVYYPPHLILYRLMTVEAAYTTSLTLHTFWAALGTAWAARRFGVSPSGAILAGFVGATCGFYQIHLTHPWAVTSGSWMPWIWGLGWRLKQGDGGWRTALLLAGAVAVQVLPGHFQLAFETQVGLLILIAPRSFDRRSLWPLLAMGFAGALASMQLMPTWRLARLAETSRTWDYLSGFASTPWHLVSYVAPGLFHRSPLWRPVAWDPFHTSPEEHLAYVGLAPLFLALGAVWRGWKRNRGVRALAILALVATLLSFGPYVPGFSLLIDLPGFSFFRAPSRWGLASMTALAILSGAGLDLLKAGDWSRPGRSLLRFLTLAVMPPVVLVLTFELALASTDGPGWPSVASSFERVRSALPWTGDPTFREVMATTRRPQTNPIVVSALLRKGLDPSSRLDRMRGDVYWQELAPSAVLMGALAGLAILGRKPRLFVLGLVGLSVLDLLWMGRQRDLDTGPIRPMTEQSSVLAALQTRPRGTRTIDPLGNLSMRAGVNPVRAYRTLDLPTMPELTSLASSPWPSTGPSKEQVDAMNAVGAQVRVLDPFEASRIDLEALRHRGFSVQTLEDPSLAGWLFGEKWARSGRPGATRFVLASLNDQAEHAFRIGPETDSILSTANPMPLRAVLHVLEDAPSVEITARSPGRIDVGPIMIFGGTDEALLVLPVQHDPQWRGVWKSGTRTLPTDPLRAFPIGPGGGWLSARAPGPGRWTLSWVYDPSSERLGQWIALPGWLAWDVAMAATCWRRRKNRPRTAFS